MRKSAVLFLTFLTFFVICFSLGAVIELIGASNNPSIYIDPGHGGFDGGATSLNKDTVEKDITLPISLKLAYFLEQMGYKVYLTRNSDVALAKTKTEDIHKRVKLINESSSILYISIHANSYPQEKAKGAQTFYNDCIAANQELAQAIMEMLKIIDPYNNREAKSIQGKYLIDKTQKIGCLVEVGFLSNTLEKRKLKTEDYQEKLAYTIFLGIMKYLGNSGDNSYDR